MYHFTRMPDIHYICPIIDQGDCAEKLSQAADLICTVEAIAQKIVLTEPESEFFHSKRDFTKKIYKNIAKKKL